MYQSPDYPQSGTNSFLNNYTWQGYDQQWGQPQSMYYGAPYGYQPMQGYPTYDPDSRRNPVGMYPQQQPQQNPFAQPQQQYQPQQIMPFTSYGGSGIQPQQSHPSMPVMPTLDMTAQQNPFAQPYAPQYQEPTFQPQPAPQPQELPNPWAAQQYPTFQQTNPLFMQVPMIAPDRKIQNWENVYTQPQQIPTPSFDWTPQQQPQPQFMQQYQPPIFQQNPVLNISWMETYRRHKAGF